MGSIGGSNDYFMRQLSSNDDGSAPTPAPAPRQLEEWECGGGSSATGRRGSRRWSRKKARPRGHRRGGSGRFCSVGGCRGGRVEAGDGGGGPELRGQARHDVGAHPHRQPGGFLTLLHVMSRGSDDRGEDASALANFLGSLCGASFY
ncbi:hypothetical protein D1007_08480 [Hordeum vulgare]|nr:hypothetical protein D1007_08480 [Hordeum vulgare]